MSDRFRKLRTRRKGPCFVTYYEDRLTGRVFTIPEGR